jgi:hypothetical protein
MKVGVGVGAATVIIIGGYLLIAGLIGGNPSCYGDISPC